MVEGKDYPMHAFKSTSDFSELDLSFLESLTSNTMCLVEHRWFGGKGRSVIAALSKPYKVTRKGKEMDAYAVQVRSCDNFEEYFNDDTEVDMTIMYVPELYPKRLFARTDDCPDCINEGYATCLRCDCIMNGKEVTLLDIHRHCCSEDLRDACFEILCSLSKFVANRENAMLETFSEFLGKVLFDNTEKVIKSVEEPEEPEHPSGELPDDFWMELKHDNWVLHFTVDGVSHYRTVRKVSDAQAMDILYGIYQLSKGEETGSKRAVSIFNSVTRKRTDSVYAELLKDTEDELDRVRENAKLELDAVREELASVRKQLYSAQMQLASMQDSNCSCTDGNPILQCGLTELYAGEFKDHLLSVLSANLGACSETDYTSRRYDIFKNMLECNEVSGQQNKLRTELRRLLLSNNIHSPNIVRELRNLGFEMVPRGSGHVQLYPIGYPQYALTLASTPSDRRTRENEISQIIKKLFK